MEMKSVCALLGALALTACAASQEPIVTEADIQNAKQMQAIQAKQTTLTGSRIPGRMTSEQMLRSTGQQDFRDSTEVKSIGNTLHANGQ